ncbi:MAG: hypothetical protein K2Y28_02605 [Burkholderiaceae bacterium]|nr:hypothetical protein [Burkholderiaceae bacterium]
MNKKRIWPRLTISMAILFALAYLVKHEVRFLRYQNDGIKTVNKWQAFALADLNATHNAILTAHPGVIDPLNPAFKEWTETGYQQALKLIPKVMSYDTAMSAVRFYTTGFLDGHLLYSDNVRKNYPVVNNGWKIEKVDQSYIVTATAEKWPAPLPEKGSKLIHCDGRLPATIINEDVAPYVDRRDNPVTQARLAEDLMRLLLSGSELKRCQFQSPAGAVFEIDVTYSSSTQEQFFQLLDEASHHQWAPRTNNFSLKNGVLWIRAANFNLQSATTDMQDLEKMLDEIPRLRNVHQIVFDVRGNSGGDSRIGVKIFNAATGGLWYDTSNIDQLPPQFAEWRVSNIAISSFARAVEHAAKLYGAQSAQGKEAANFLAELNAAKLAGQAWVRQDAGHLITRADIEKRGGRLLRFNGKIALITDNQCASACLDFADLVRQVPGAIHLGRRTSADTLYIDTGQAELPSGNLLVLPLKVWRNRIRANNEALEPNFVLDVDMNNDVAVYDATLAALKTSERLGLKLDKH